MHRRCSCNIEIKLDNSKKKIQPELFALICTKCKSSPALFALYADDGETDIPETNIHTDVFRQYHTIVFALKRLLVSGLYKCSNKNSLIDPKSTEKITFGLPVSKTHTLKKLPSVNV